MKLPDQYIFGGNNVNIKVNNIGGIIVDNGCGGEFFLLVIYNQSNPNISSR
jgi:proline racemase